MHAGTYTVSVRRAADDGRRIGSGCGSAVQTDAGTVHGPSFEVDSDSSHTVVVTTDPEKHQIASDHRRGGPPLVRPRANLQPIQVADLRVPMTVRTLSRSPRTPTPPPTLCQSLIH